jgi:hypothetical protein
MIKITRPLKVPKTLKKKGADLTKANCDAFDKNEVKFIEKFTVDSAVYGAKSVKKALKKAQHNKCCFCEKDQVDEYGAVEHYRPKAGYKIDKSEKELAKPGYYWLAYNWDNLLFVCGPCNTTYKQNFFPLQDELQRCKSHKDPITRETPLLLDPCGNKDPRDHIFFQNQFPMYKDAFGQRTIELCGLDRDELNDQREKLINDIEARLIILSKKEQFSNAQINKAKDYIIHCQSEQAEYSSMARDYLAQFNIVIA